MAFGFFFLILLQTKHICLGLAAHELSRVCLSLFETEFETQCSYFFLSLRTESARNARVTRE